MHTDRCGNTRRQNCRAKGSGKEVKIQEFRYRDTSNVEPEMYDYTNNNWSHWNSYEKLKEKFGRYIDIQVGSNMTGTDLYVNKPHCAAAVRP